MLISLLDAPGSLDEGAGWIAQFRDMVEEARVVLPTLHAEATAPAGEAGVKHVVGKRFPTFPQPVRTEGEWKAWWEDWFTALADLPLVGVEAGMRAWLAIDQTGFLPKPGQLRALALTTPSRTINRYQRAKRAVEMVDAVQGANVREPAEREAVGAMLQEFRAALGRPRGVIVR